MVTTFPSKVIQTKFESSINVWALNCLFGWDALLSSRSSGCFAEGIHSPRVWGLVCLFEALRSHSPSSASSGTDGSVKHSVSSSDEGAIAFTLCLSCHATLEKVPD